MKKLLIITALLVSTASFGQDPTFTQFYANPLYLNPALAGSYGCSRFASNYRNEWPSLSSNYVTYSASWDNYFSNLSGGVGILATHDQQGSGTISTSMLGLIYSYHAQLTRKLKFQVGARAAWYQKSLDWDKLTFGDMIDPRRGFIYSTGDVPRGGSRGFFDASMGAVLFSKNFFAGIAWHHMNKPNESMIVGDSRLPWRWTVHMGAEIQLGRKSKYSNGTSIMPNVIYQNQNGFQELSIGTYFKYNAFTMGVWYRNRDAFIITAGINTGRFKLGYSYDVTVSKLNNGVTRGSHEISMGINLTCKPKIQQFKLVSCPSF
jgi:type IX secretion system PorP/SprF family membrane protein